MTSPMLRLVRHKTTRAYLGTDGRWTYNHASAQRFGDIHAILRTQRQLKLTEIELVLQMGTEPSPEYDIALPLENPWC